jgi:hypothetical protein
MAKSAVHDPEDFLPGEEEDLNAYDPVIWKPKLTIAQIGGNPGIVVQTKKAEPIVLFIGQATGIKTVDDPNHVGNTFIALTGAFKATNLQTGVVYRSGIMYLPSGFHDAVVDQLDREFGDGTSDHRPVEFALEISAVPANNPIKYSYEAKSLLPPARDAGFARLERTVERTRRLMLALEAPGEAREAPRAAG